jgi:hypothetical protein
MSSNFQDILDSLINGQLKQAIEQVEQYNICIFVTDLEKANHIDAHVRLLWLSSLIRGKRCYE